MAKNIVIAIARQNGSGGREVGKRLAEELGISFYDKELIQLTAQKSGIQESICEEAEETATNSLLYTIAIGGNIWGGNNMLERDLPITDRIFIAQAGIIKKIAQEESAVIVGRCADDILRNSPNCIKVYIYADMQFRLNRIGKIQGISDEKAVREIRRMDKKRANYYNYFTDKKWGQVENYTLAINTAEVGVDGAFEIIKRLYQHKQED